MNGKSKSHEGENAIVKQHAPQPSIRDRNKPARQINPTVVVQRMAASPSSTLDSASILSLQRTIGNRAVQRMLAQRAQGSTIPTRTLSRLSIQPKVMVGPAADQYEQEADRVAERVMSMPATATTDHAQRQNKEEEELQKKPLSASITPKIRRMDDEETQAKPLAASISAVAQRAVAGAEKEEEEFQTKPSPHHAEADGSFEAGSDLESRLAQSKGSGSPLPEDTRAFMESRFGADFSDVRAHTGAEAVQLNREVSAQAFTHGSDIYFGSGKYSPDTDSGKQLLAHELTHVIQQRG